MLKSLDIIQGKFGVNGNFELVVTARSSGIDHYYRNNDDHSFPWIGPSTFAAGLTAVEAVTLIQSNFGSPGNLEVVALASGKLYHCSRDSDFPWSNPVEIASDVRGNPSLVQSKFRAKGNFELVAPAHDGGINFYWRNNDAPDFPWSSPEKFATSLGLVDSVTMILSNFNDMDVIARVGSKLYHIWRDPGPAFAWSSPQQIGDGAHGTPVLIQSRFGARGNFELVAPGHLQEPGLPRWT